jgi:membrane-associated protease RseP (regulator of RpoE activity)
VLKKEEWKMKRNVNLSYVAIALIVLACLTFGFLMGGLVGGVAGYALARYQGPRGAQVPRPITPPQIEPEEIVPEEIVPFDLTREAQPYLGVRYQVVTPELAEEEGLSTEHGALVREVIPDSPADQGGLQEGDVITAVDDQAVDDDHPLDELIREHEVGDQVELTVVRKGRERSLKVKLGARSEYFFRFPPEGFPEMPPEDLPLPPLERFRIKRTYLGIRYQTITPELAEEEGLSTEQGALVREVMPDSPAEEGGLQEGDVITAVDGQAVDDDHPLDELIREHEVGDQVGLTVVRKGQELFLKVELGASGYFIWPPTEHFREIPPRFSPDSA